MTRTKIVVILFALAALVSWSASLSDPFRILAASFPIATVLVLMLFGHFSTQAAGPIAWIIGLSIGRGGFGLTFEVFWVSQFKALLIAGSVLAVLWSSLILYHIVAQAGGINAIMHALERLIMDQGLLLIALAWTFSGMLEGLAGFGLPIAIVAPMLVHFGVQPVVAVAVVAIGHAWSVTFGDMGVIFQTLTGLVDISEEELIPITSFLLGVVGFASGLSVAHILKQSSRMPAIVVVAAAIAIVQYATAAVGLVPLASLLAGLAGTLCLILISRHGHASLAFLRLRNCRAIPGLQSPSQVAHSPLGAALLSYGGLTFALLVIAVDSPVEEVLRQVVLRISFPDVETASGFVTQKGLGQIIYPLTHPGTLIFLVAVVSFLGYRQMGLCSTSAWSNAHRATRKSAVPATIGIVTMVGLSTLMEHTGMVQLLAENTNSALGHTYPLVAPFIGILGAFATGSNNNSNVLFAQLQETVAILLGVTPSLLIAAQTSGGALGSMVAPAKIVVGCANVAQEGKEGEVLRITLPYAIAIGSTIGILTLFIAILT